MNPSSFPVPDAGARRPGDMPLIPPCHEGNEPGEQDRPALPPAAPPTLRVAKGDGRRTLGALLVCHTINDFYGLVMPPLLPALNSTGSHRKRTPTAIKPQ